MSFKRLVIRSGVPPSPQVSREAEWDNTLPRRAQNMYPPPGIYAVWHSVNPTFMTPTHVERQAFPQGYIHVADVACKDVGMVYQLTNHIDRPWQNNKEIVWAVSQGRSTSVGDIITATTALTGSTLKGQELRRRWSIEPVGLQEF